VLYRELGYRQGIAQSLSLLARVEAHQGDYGAARVLSEESLTIARKVDDKVLIAFCLEGLASVVAAQGESAWATRIWGAVEALRDAMGVPLPPVERAGYERSVSAARAQLGETAFTAAWAEGRTLTVEQAFAAQRPAPAPPAKAPSYPAGLTERELEVLRLVAQGLTNAQIAEQLIVSPHTVHAHVRSIHSKLGVTSRSAVTRYAFGHHLA